jgi:hypothetical protein
MQHRFSAATLCGLVFDQRIRIFVVRDTEQHITACVSDRSTCHRVLQWKWLNWSSWKHTYLTTPFVILDIVWFILVGCQWRSLCVRRNCGQRMKSHGATCTLLLLHGEIKSKRRTCGAKQVGSNMKSMKYLRRTTAKTPFPRSIFSIAALSSDANKRNSCLHERKAFHCCRSLCHRSPPSSGTKSLLLVAEIPSCPWLAALAASRLTQQRCGNSSTRSWNTSIWTNASLAAPLNTRRGKGTLR